MGFGPAGQDGDARYWTGITLGLSPGGFWRSVRGTEAARLTETTGRTHRPWCPSPRSDASAASPRAPLPRPRSRRGRHCSPWQREGGRGRRDLKGFDPEVKRPPYARTPPTLTPQATPPSRRRGVGAWCWFEFGASFPGAECEGGGVTIRIGSAASLRLVDSRTALRSHWLVLSPDPCADWSSRKRGSGRELKSSLPVWFWHLPEGTAFPGIGLFWGLGGRFSFFFLS